MELTLMETDMVGSLKDAAHNCGKSFSFVSESLTELPSSGNY